MKSISIVGVILGILLLFVSCSVKDDPNALIDTEFAAEVVDSNNVLSPKTYSYLHNIKSPLGVKPVIVAVEKIENSQMGTFADDLFEQFCEKKYSGNTFKQRGVLIVASKNPELIQVRVGSTYEVYCRMRGSAAGNSYLSMQKEVPVRGIDEMCPVALQNVLSDIIDCRQLPWYKKVSLKLSFIHIEMIMDDVATPSKSLFSQFYFRPFLFVVGLIKSLFGNWLFSFLFIAMLYTLIKNWTEEKLNKYVEKKANEDGNNDEDYMNNLVFYSTLKTIIVFLIKLIITIPTLTAISILSTSRMEDVIALREANIPSVDVVEKVTHWSNNISSLWMILLLMIVYYVKFLFCDKGIFTCGHFSDEIQQNIYKNNRARLIFDNVINTGYNRHSVQKLFKGLFGILIGAGINQNFHEMNTETIGDNYTEIDDKGKPKKRLVDFLFLDTNSSLYKQSPLLALLVNAHREALFLTAFVGLAAIVVLSYTYVLYFLVLWVIQLFFRIVNEYMYVNKNMKSAMKEFIPFRLIKKVWKTEILFLIVMTSLFAILAPSYSAKTTEAIVEVKRSLPEDFSGLYFVQKANGETVKGVTARIKKGNKNNYFLQVYSDKPIRRFGLMLDENVGMFHCDVLGDGYITYDEQTKSIKINFSDLWVLTN